MAHLNSTIGACVVFLFASHTDGRFCFYISLEAERLGANCTSNEGSIYECVVGNRTSVVKSDTNVGRFPRMVGMEITRTTELLAFIVSLTLHTNREAARQEAYFNASV
mmetsp:Transcript_15264/g.20852  ORF Transcript_15264/g.20852 Transcript_15264/m.20852 type:complete len:108 (-) Transcript_15264:82-405(-)